jgi:hypothetical protein
MLLSSPCGCPRSHGVLAVNGGRAGSAFQLAKRALDRLEDLARQKRLWQKTERLRRLGASGGLAVDQPGQEDRCQSVFLAQQAGQLDAVDRAGQPDIDREVSVASDSASGPEAAMPAT